VTGVGNSKSLRPSVQCLEDRLPLSAGGGISNATIATGLFREVFLHNPTIAQTAKIVATLDAGGTVMQVADGMYRSPAFRAEQVKSYYEEMLGREPTSSELRDTKKALRSGVSEEQVLNNLAGSQQFYVASGGNASAFVRALYLDLLGRQADANGLAAYVGQIYAGMTRQAVAGEFTSSADFKQFKVTDAYQAVLNRAPDSNELANWTSDWASLGGVEGVTVGILSSPDNLVRLGQPGGIPLPNLVATNELRRILEASYTEGSTGFVGLYNQLLDAHATYDAKGHPIPTTPGNVALWNLIDTGGSTDGTPVDEIQQVTPMSVNVSSLIPLQTDIDLNKSLKYALANDPATSGLKVDLAGGVILHPAGVMLTADGGHYILDGHHRWSSIYVLNPYAQLSAIDVGYEPSPQDSLKTVQLAVGAQVGFLPVQTVEGPNLFTISREEFTTWVAHTIENGKSPSAVINVFDTEKGLSGIPSITNYLWANVERMRQFNRPAPGSTSRGYMPQPPDGNYTPMLHLLESGALNDKFPIISRLG
jgi:hypothetical protein